MDKELKREIIIENSQNPFHKCEVSDESYNKVNTRNPNCIDNLDIYIKFNDDVIEDIKFNGEACAISTSSTSIMIKNLIGKNVSVARDYINNFYNMCEEKEYNSELLNEAECFSDIYKQSNRVHCATLPYKGIIKALDEYEEK